MRYAIYFAADADDPLMRLGNAWLGRDPFDGRELTQPPVDGLSEDRFHELTTDPRRYGFHGTLKAPFSLRDGQSETALVDACARFAAEIAPYEIDGLGVNRLGRFLALTPSGPAPGLAAFAGLCVRRFEPFRAPLAEADLERRRRSSLTGRQNDYLCRWGYPYIFDEFRFHMTLSNKLENDREADLLAAAAATFFAEVTGRPRTCRHLALYTEADRGAPFQVKELFELTGGLSPLDAEASADGPTRKEPA
jgi:putative phosphonate metabolism protein